MLSISVIALIIANLVPIFGVIFFEWSVFVILFLYWFENLVIGFYNLLRMWRAYFFRPDQHTLKMYINGKQKMIGIGLYAGFFIIHVWFFTVIHAFFIFTIFGSYDIPFLSFLISSILLIISHGISHYYNFIKKEEYKRIKVEILFWQPYLRFFILHTTVLLGAWLTQLLGAPIGALVILVILKIVVDVLSHLYEHRKFFETKLKE